MSIGTIPQALAALRQGRPILVADDESRKVVDAISATPTGAGDRPVDPVVIESVTMEQR